MHPTDNTRAPNPYAGKRHEMKSGRSIKGVSHSWAQAVDDTLETVLNHFPSLRHVAISVPKATRDVRRLFHFDGQDWIQVHLAEFADQKFDVTAVVRGAKELDGDPAFNSELSSDSLLLRQIVGRKLEPDRKANLGQHASLTEWVEARLRPILDYAGEMYIAGATSDQARKGREQSLITIQRLIRHLRQALRPNQPFCFPEGNYRSLRIEHALDQFLIKRALPFAPNCMEIFGFQSASKANKDKAAKRLWAAAARMPHDARFDTIYGALLRQAEGHPVFGDADYRRLEALLAADLAAGFHVVRIDGNLFIYSKGRWRAATTDRAVTVDWSKGRIVSRNYGRVIVPPHRREGEMVDGYTRNGPGEGPAEARETPFTMRCVDRPIEGTNLNWIHAYHAWELAGD